jgi:adenosylcobyric acid synthase
MKNVMLLSTHSGVGKHLICCAVIRLLVKLGYAVSPFKSIAVENYTCRLEDGYEISFAQAIQAVAAKKMPIVEMNPYVALYNNSFALIELGKRLEKPPDLVHDRARYSKVIKESFKKIEKMSEIVVIEGGGSPVELGLEDIDLVNIPVAQLSDSKILLVTDMMSGGGYASIIGTLKLLPEVIRQRVIGVILSKFDIDKPHELALNGIKQLEGIIERPVIRIPFLQNTFIPEEDVYYDVDFRPSKNYNNELDKLAELIGTYLDTSFILEEIKD